MNNETVKYGVRRVPDRAKRQVFRIKRQDEYLVALLENPTLQKASAAVGVSEVTL